ncbi:hypothetical protein ACFUJU_16970 [Streptomyces sp. NPDC057235]|uniref:hypothetical protein n=1 Tax=Streptomyces sp. NPDC057235 TaxID=3346058 RepID=UPI00363372E4
MKNNSPNSAIRLGSPNAPIEGSDAGPSDDLVRAHLESNVRRYRRQAKQALSDAQRSVNNPERSLRFSEISLSAAAKAFWWAEDTPLEDRQHQLMHQVGRWKRKNLGCSLTYDGVNYSQRCPIAIAHKKIGFSIGFTAVRFCSICNEDLSSENCSHFRDRSYWVRGGAVEGASCRVCHDDSCNHRPDTLYRTQVVSVVDENSGMALHEVSIVHKPAQPEARLTEIPIELNDLARKFRSSFLPGLPVSCDKCLYACEGFTGLSDNDEE